MITVRLKKSSNYPIDTKRVKKELVNFFNLRGIVSDAEVSVAFVGSKTMLELASNYLKEGVGSEEHSVLTFLSQEGGKGFIYPPGTIFLGEIIISYPKVLEEAKKEGKLIDDKVSELTLHGASHLMGVHHD